MIKLSYQHNGLIPINQRIKFKDKEGVVSERILNINNLELRVNIQESRWIEQDITCNSSFMVDHIREIGITIHQTYSFLAAGHPIYLFMDNAGS